MALWLSASRICRDLLPRNVLFLCMVLISVRGLVNLRAWFGWKNHICYCMWKRRGRTGPGRSETGLDGTERDGTGRDGDGDSSVRDRDGAGRDGTDSEPLCCRTLHPVQALLPCLCVWGGGVVAVFLVTSGQFKIGTFLFLVRSLLRRP
jgi:hypothetical protein